MHFAVVTVLFCAMSLCAIASSPSEHKGPLLNRSPGHARRSSTKCSSLKKRMVKQPKSRMRREGGPDRQDQDRNRFQYGAARQSESNAVNPSDLEFTASTGAAGTTGSSAYASPSPTASAAVASSWVAPTASSSSSSSASSKTFTGEATYFYQNGVAGACGTVHSDDEKVVALMTTMYGDTGSQSQYCGRTVVITNNANSKSVTATVADACPSCSSASSLDLSVGAFTAIGEQATGVLDISWRFSD